MDKAMRTRADAEHLAVKAMGADPANHPFLHRGIAMIEHGGFPDAVWREVAVMLSLEHERLSKQLMDMLALTPMRSVLVESSSGQ